MLLTAAPAGAHAALVASDPAEGARIEAPPQNVTLTFNEPIQQQFAAVAVTGPDGGSHTVGEPTATGREVSIALDGLGAAGSYTVAYRVVSADGHPVAGQYRFVLTKSATATSTAPTVATPESSASVAAAERPGADGGLPVWPFAAAAIALVAIIIGTVLARSRRSQ